MRVIAIILIIGMLSYILMTRKTNVKRTLDAHYDTIYLKDNGSHLDIILQNEARVYKAYGWGSKEFYTNVPTWGDLSFKKALKALFYDESIIRVNTYHDLSSEWIPIKVSKQELTYIEQSICNSFKRYEGNIYYISSGLHEAHGQYTPFNTCNTWVNDIFKGAGLLSRKWLIFSSGLSNLYKE